MSDSRQMHEKCDLLSKGIRKQSRRISCHPPPRAICTCSGDQSRFEDIPRSLESLATRDFSTNGSSSKIANRETMIYMRFLWRRQITMLPYTSRKIHTPEGQYGQDLDIFTRRPCLCCSLVSSQRKPRDHAACSPPRTFSTRPDPISARRAFNLGFVEQPRNPTVL
jgi:hypothetical protein